MEIKIEDQEYEGFAVVKDISNLKIKARFKDKGDLIRIKTCHRSMDIEQAWKQSSFGWVDKDSAKINLQLNTPIEDKEYCPIEIIAFSHSGKHSWAFIDKKTANENLSAIYRCNGETRAYKGVGICQSYKGLEQQIEFPEKTNVRSNCPYERLDDQAFKYNTKKGYCVYIFKSESGQYHRLTTIGYESIKLKQ